MRYYLVNGTDQYDGMEWLLQVIVIASNPENARKKADKVMKEESHQDGISEQSADGSITEIGKEEALILNKLAYTSIVRSK